MAEVHPEQRHAERHGPLGRAQHGSVAAEDDGDLRRPAADRPDGGLRDALADADQVRLEDEERESALAVHGADERGGLLQRLVPGGMEEHCHDSLNHAPHPTATLVEPDPRAKRRVRVEIT